MKPTTLRRVYLREATVMLVMAQLAARFASPARLLAWVNRPPRCINRFAVDEIDWVSWAVETIGAKRSRKARPLPSALAVQMMLRRRGIASRLCLGVADAGEATATHAWVELAQDSVVRGVEAQMTKSNGERV
jgi:Transglutaminase-like superfamily